MKSYFDEHGKPITDFLIEKNGSVCESTDNSPLFNIENFSYVRCSSCFSVFNSEMLKDSFVAEMYNSGVYKEYFPSLVQASQEIQKDVLEKRKFEQINSFFGKPGKILDVSKNLPRCQLEGFSSRSFH